MSEWEHAVKIEGSAISIEWKNGSKIYQPCFYSGITLTELELAAMYNEGSGHQGTPRDGWWFSYFDNDTGEARLQNEKDHVISVTIGPCESYSEARTKAWAAADKKFFTLMA